MKLILLIASFTMASLIADAQSENKFIEVNGYTNYSPVNEIYFASIVMTMDFLPEDLYSSFENFKKIYFDKLLEVKFDTSLVTENYFMYLSYGFEKEGTIIQVETKSKKEIIKLLLVKMPGIQIKESYIKFTFSPDYISQLTGEAIINARLIADKTLIGTGKKTGEIISIINSNPIEHTESLINPNFEKFYSLTVRFALVE